MSIAEPARVRAMRCERVEARQLHLAALTSCAAQEVVRAGLDVGSEPTLPLCLPHDAERSREGRSLDHSRQPRAAASRSAASLMSRARSVASWLRAASAFAYSASVAR